MTITFTPEERLMYLTIMLGGANRLVHGIYQNSDPEQQARILDRIAEYNLEIEPVMDMYGLGRDPESVARAMVLTEDLIGCEPKGELLSVGPDEAVRRVTYCPWADAFDGDTCRFQMAAMERGLGRKYGLEIQCDQTMADGADCCIWRVRKAAG